MKFAILGAGGCFGLNLARFFIGRGHDVVGIGRSSLRGEAFALDLARARANWRYHQYSIGPDTEFLLDVLDAEKPAVIVNFAAQGEGAASFRPAKHWKYFYHTNAVALVELTEHLASRPWLERFIHIGTSELYGPVTRPAPEDAPLVPTSPYAASKAAFDLHLQAIHKVLGFPMNIVRPSNCYTPGQQLHRIVPKALLYAVTGRKLPLHGGGRAEKSYLHGTDLSRAILLVAERAPLGELYNVGPEEPTSIRRVVELCAAAAGVDFDELVEITGDRIGQDSRYWLDAGKVRALGWAPEISWAQGLAGMVDWVRRYQDDLRECPAEFVMRA